MSIENLIKVEDYIINPFNTELREADDIGYQKKGRRIEKFNNNGFSYQKGFEKDKLLWEMFEFNSEILSQNPVFGTSFFYQTISKEEIMERFSLHIDDLKEICLFKDDLRLEGYINGHKITFLWEAFRETFLSSISIKY